MKIAVVGSSNTDMIVRSQHIPRPGETVLGGVFQTAAGGKGANQAVAAARTGGDVTFIARVGDDMFGHSAIEGFRRDGINVDHITIDKNSPSGVALIMVDDNGENSIAVAGGANNKLGREDVEAAQHAIADAKVLLMQLEIPLHAVKAAAEIANKHNVPVILNPAPAQKLPAELLQRIAIITPNETEAELFTGIKVSDRETALAAAKALRTMGPDIVIITIGASGVFLSSPEFEGAIPGFEQDAVDTTAAGDVFNGALASRLALGATIQEAVRYAQAAAAISVTRMGAQPSAPKNDEIEAFLRSKK